MTPRSIALIRGSAKKKDRGQQSNYTRVFYDSMTIRAQTTLMRDFRFAGKEAMRSI